MSAESISVLLGEDDDLDAHVLRVALAKSSEQHKGTTFTIYLPRLALP
jgi:hypothetical protein